MPSSNVSSAAAASSSSSKRSASCVSVPTRNSINNNNNNNKSASSFNTKFAHDNDNASEISNSSSLGWSGDYCKKMMALNWDYSCGPLRVIQVGPHNHHWARLHAPGYAVLPQADGTLQHFREPHRHISDEELIREVLRSGVSKVKPQPKVTVGHISPRNAKDVDVDFLKQRLISQSLPLPPARPDKQLIDRCRVPIYDDASTIFSCTDVSSAASNNNNNSSIVSSSQQRKSSCQNLKNNNIAAKKVTPINAAAAGGIIAAAASSTTKKKRSSSGIAAGSSSSSSSNVSSINGSRRPSSRQQEQAATKALESVREETSSVKSELERARRTLESIEKTIDDHHSSCSASERNSNANANNKERRQQRQKEKEDTISQQTRSSKNTRELALQLAASRRAATPFC